jgi:hypothetical protein
MAGVRPRVFGAPIGLIGALTSARERPPPPRDNAKTVTFEATGIPRGNANHATTPGLVGGARS